MGKMPEEEKTEGLARQESEAPREQVPNTVRHGERVSHWRTKPVPGRCQRYLNQIRLAREMIRDYRSGAYRRVPWRSLGMLAVALVYLVIPVDLVPDILPGVGLVDDTAVFFSILFALRADLLSYCLFKGYEPADYF